MVEWNFQRYRQLDSRGSPNPQYRNFNDFVTAHNVAVYQVPTGFTENFQSSLQQTIAEDLSISSGLVFSEYSVPRNNEIMKMMNDGRIPEDIIAGMRLGPNLDFDMLTRWVRKNVKDADPFLVPTDAEIRKRISVDLRALRKGAQDISSRADAWGMIGRFTGGAAVALDPALLPTYAVGIGAAAHAGTFLRAAGRGFLAGAFVEGAGETAVQFFPGGVYSWKNEIGVDYSVKNAITQIAAVAGIGGGITATAAAIAKGLAKTKNWNMSGASKTERWAKEKLDRTADEMNEAPDPDMPAVDHADNIEQTVNAQQTKTYPEDVDPELIVEEAEVDAIFDALPDNVKNRDIVIEDDLGGSVTVNGGQYVTRQRNSVDAINSLIGCYLRGT